MKYLVLVIGLVSCLSPRKADRQLAKINSKFPGKVATNCADSFKIVEKHDTSVTVEYDWIELEPEIKFDTTNDTIVKQKYVMKERVQYKTITITKNVENTARVKELSDRLNQSISLYKKADYQAKKYKGVTKILSFLLALIIIAFYFAFKRKK